MAIGVLDLSIVTDQVIKHLNDALDSTRLWIENTASGIDPGRSFQIHFSGDAPEVIRGKDGCECSVYLFHVTPDAFHRNTFPRGGPARRTPEQPFALTMHYLLSCHADSYIEEQQAMSIALKCLHEHSIAHAMVPLGGRDQEFTITMEPETVDSIGRLWQAMATPLRLSAVFRVSVVFIEPQEPPARETRLVLRPEVTAIPFDRAVRGIASATATAAGLVTLRGVGFDAQSFELRIGGLLFERTPTDPPAPGTFHVVDAMRVDLQLPDQATAGKYLLHVQFDPDDTPMDLWVTVP